MRLIGLYIIAFCGLLLVSCKSLVYQDQSKQPVKNTPEKKIIDIKKPIVKPSTNEVSNLEAIQEKSIENELILPDLIQDAGELLVP